jgi:hypothetical protein
MMNMQINKFIPWILILILLVLLFNKQPNTIVLSNDKPYRDSIDHLLTQIQEKNQIIGIRELTIDSLSNIKIKNHIQYVTVFKFINRENITHTELDSLVRLYSNIH